MNKPSKPDGGKAVIERLDVKRHDRKTFNSGADALDSYLKERAGQEQKRQLAFTYVLTLDDAPAIQGYYTLSATSIPLDDLPPDIAKQTRYPVVPGVLIGRLARDVSLRGQDYGQHLLLDALRRIARSGDFAVKLIIVDPKDEKAADFYTNYGFQPLGDEKGQMFIAFDTIKNL